MCLVFKILRPVGNRIENRLDTTSIFSFEPYNSRFYNSGTAALAAALTACTKLKPMVEKPEAIIPAYGCPDLISACVYVGILPVLVDLDPDSPHMSLNEINIAVSNNTVAIIAVNFLGIPERIDELLKITNQNDLMLIEDSAQAFPSISTPNTYWKADFVITSFGRGKPVNLLGGGCVLIRNSKLLDLLPKPSPNNNSLIARIKYKLKILTYNLSIRPVPYGILARIPALKIGQTIYKPLNTIYEIPKHIRALLNANLNIYQQRHSWQKEFNEMLAGNGNANFIDVPDELSFNFLDPLLRYPILVRDKVLRDLTHEKLKRFGSSRMYEKPLYQIDNVGGLIKQQGNYPNATRFADRLLTLPNHEAVNKKILLKIHNIVNSIS